MECVECHMTGFTDSELQAHTGSEPCQIGISTRDLANHIRFDECEAGLQAVPDEDPRIGKLEDRILELERTAHLALTSGNVAPPQNTLEGGHDTSEEDAPAPPKGGKNRGR